MFRFRGFIIRVYVWWIAFSGFLLFVFSGSSSGSCLMVRGFLLFVYVPGSFLTAVRRFFLAGDSSESPGSQIALYYPDSHTA